VAPMNATIVHYYPRAWAGDGGCSAAVRGWASAMAEMGARVTVVSDGQGEPPDISHVRWLSVPHRALGGMRAPVGLDSVLEGADLLILHSAWVYHNVHAARAATRSAVPYVLTPHGAYDPNIFKRRRVSKQLWWSIFERRLVTRASAIHVFFEEQREDLRQLGYRGAVIIAPTGLALPAAEPRAARAQFVLWMGRFDVEIKGLDLLLHALASLPAASRPHTRLHGPDWRGGKQQTAELVRALDLEQWVTIGPPLYGTAKWQALHDCALFVFASRWEGQGLMALEAAAAAATLVVTNTTSVGRHLAAARAAILVEPTAQSLAAGIVQGCTLGDAGELGTRAAQLVRDKYSWPAVVERYIQQLSDV
jgi:glycosyltransferase involved in cell wall biosynthesis